MIESLLDCMETGCEIMTSSGGGTRKAPRVYGIGSARSKNYDLEKVSHRARTNRKILILRAQALRRRLGWS